MSTKGRAECAKLTPAGHYSTVLRVMPSTAKLNRKGPATTPCLTPVSTSIGVVHPAGVRTAAVILLFMSFIRRTNSPGTPSAQSALRRRPR
ncbi:hypothetical protein RB195_025536 [Necator americanus]|uniref:Uncharacterized protein n=1 Tax=Necator americanus TaxID=51031 RepID=A0ABR1ESR2_NECAM